MEQEAKSSKAAISIGFALYEKLAAPLLPQTAKRRRKAVGK